MFIQNNYPIYNVPVLKEIIYRLTVKDKMKKLKKKHQTIFRSRVTITEILTSMQFHSHHIDMALNIYDKVYIHSSP